MFGLLSRIFGTTNDRIIKKLKKEIVHINQLENYYAALSDDELKQKNMLKMTIIIH